MGKKVFGETGMRALLNGLKTQFDTKADLVDGKLAAAQMPPVSFNDLTDNPLGTQSIAGFDLAVPDNVQELDSIGIGDGAFVYRVADPLTREQLSGSTLVAEQYESNILTGTETMVITDADIEDVGNDVIIAGDGVVVSVLKDGAEWADVGATNLVAGLYLMKVVDGSITMYASLRRSSEVVQRKLSYNDLADRPCYKDIVSGSKCHYELPQDLSDTFYVDAEVNGTPVRFYRVGDAITAQQLNGATLETVSTVTGEEPNVQTLSNPRYDTYDGYLDIYDTSAISVTASQAEIFGVEFTQGLYFVSVSLNTDPEDESQTTELKTVKLENNGDVTVKQLDPSCVPPLESLSGTLLPDQVPDLSQLHGSVTPSQLPNLSELNGDLPASRLSGQVSAQNLPSLSQLSGSVTAAQVPTLSQLYGSVTASQVPPLSELNGTIDAGRMTNGSTPLQYDTQNIDLHRYVVTQNDIPMRYYFVRASNAANSSININDERELMYGSLKCCDNFQSDTASAATIDLSLATLTSPQTGILAMSFSGKFDGKPVLVYVASGMPTYGGAQWEQGLWVSEYAMDSFRLKIYYRPERRLDCLNYPDWSMLRNNPFVQSRHTLETYLYPDDNSTVSLSDTSDTYQRLTDNGMSVITFQSIFGDAMVKDDVMGRRITLITSTYHNVALRITTRNFSTKTVQGANGDVDIMCIAHPLQYSATQAPLFMFVPEDVVINGGTFSAGLWCLTNGPIEWDYALASTCSFASSISGRVLPTVTSSDDGKVLRVVDGAWAAVSLPSASGVSF